MPSNPTPQYNNGTLQRKGSPVIIDGAIGSLILNLPISSSFPQLKLRPELLPVYDSPLLTSIHLDYLKAGAEIITTNTFNLSPSSSDFKNICSLNVRCAQDAIDEFCRETNLPGNKRPLLAASVGPSDISLTSASHNGHDTIPIRKSYYDWYQISSTLISLGVDLLLLETFFDPLNAETALLAAMQARNDINRQIPLFISFTLTHEGRLPIGDRDFTEVSENIISLNPQGIGVNCVTHSPEIIERLQQLRQLYKGKILYYPNMGMPDKNGNYHCSPEENYYNMLPLLHQNIVDILGTCCGSTPAHTSCLYHYANPQALR